MFENSPLNQMMPLALDENRLVKHAKRIMVRHGDAVWGTISPLAGKKSAVNGEATNSNGIVWYAEPFFELGEKVYLGEIWLRCKTPYKGSNWCIYGIQPNAELELWC